MNEQITAGTRVEFDSEHGTQKGTVIGVMEDVGKGQHFAAVEVDHILPGCVWQVPLNELQVKAAA